MAHAYISEFARDGKREGFRNREQEANDSNREEDWGWAGGVEYIKKTKVPELPWNGNWL
jgi:hypothetical protein